MSALPPFRPLFPAPKAAAPPRYTPGVTDFPKAVRPKGAPSVSNVEKQLAKSPIPPLNPVAKKPAPVRVPKPAAAKAVVKAPPRTTKAAVKKSPVRVAPAAPRSTSSPAASVAPTSGKTPVPARTVAPSAPVRKAPARVQAAASAPAVAQLSPDQQAAKAVDAALAPLYQQGTTQASQQNAAITKLTQAVIAALGGTPGAIASDYDQAIGQQTNLSNAAADSLRAANPNTQDQALLSAINAPAAQQAQLAAQNNAAFNGGAAVGQYVGGVLPASTLQGQKLAATSYARTLPAIEGLRGQQALSAALAKQTDARAAIDAQRPDLIQKYSDSYTSAQQRQQQLDLEAQTLGLKTQSQSFQQNLDTQKLNVSIQKYNQSTSAAANKINVAVSKSIPGGVARNSQGQPIVRNGKVVTINAAGTVSAKVPTAGQINTFITEWKAGKPSKQSVTLPNPDANGNPVVKTVTKTAGKLSYGQAYKRLLAMNLSDQKARQYLNTVYQRGEQGRSWVPNKAQAALSRAGLNVQATTIKTVSGPRGLLRPKQYTVLHKAGLLPPGKLFAEGYLITPGY